MLTICEPEVAIFKPFQGKSIQFKTNQLKCKYPVSHTTYRAFCIKTHQILVTTPGLRRFATFSFVPTPENANPAPLQAVRFYFPGSLTKASFRRMLEKQNPATFVAGFAL
jgi:hypothetical protein